MIFGLATSSDDITTAAIGLTFGELKNLLGGFTGCYEHDGGKIFIVAGETLDEVCDRFTKMGFTITADTWPKPH